MGEAKRRGRVNAHGTNRSGLPVDEVLAILAAEGVDLAYGPFMMKVNRAAIDNFKAHVAAIPAAERPLYRASIVKALDRFVERLTAADYTAKQADAAWADMILLHLLDLTATQH